MDKGVRLVVLQYKRVNLTYLVMRNRDGFIEEAKAQGWAGGAEVTLQSGDKTRCLDKVGM